MVIATRLDDALMTGRFAVTAELSRPREPDSERIRAAAQLFAGLVDAVNVTDKPWPAVHARWRSRSSCDRGDRATARRRGTGSPPAAARASSVRRGRESPSRHTLSGSPARRSIGGSARSSAGARYAPGCSSGVATRSATVSVAKLNHQALSDRARSTSSSCRARLALRRSSARPSAPEISTGRERSRAASSALALVPGPAAPATCVPRDPIDARESPAAAVGPRRRTEAEHRLPFRERRGEHRRHGQLTVEVGADLAAGPSAPAPPVR